MATICIATASHFTVAVARSILLEYYYPDAVQNPENGIDPQYNSRKAFYEANFGIWWNGFTFSKTLWLLIFHNNHVSLVKSPTTVQPCDPPVTIV